MAESTELDAIVERLRGALERFPGVAFAYLFGSAVSGRLREDSDLDVAVYLDSGAALEVESDRSVEGEADVQIAAERATDRNVDLLVLNRAPATVCATAVTTGVAVLVRDEALRSRYLLAVTTTAADFEQTEHEFREVRSRSNSLAPADRSRLERILEYIHIELEDRPGFRDVSLQRYRTDRDLRRNLDRWVEMLINAAIDIAKVVLASEHREVPRTYGQILDDVSTVEGFASLGDRLRPLAALRNTMAHEYLDLRFGRVMRFVEDDADTVADLARLTRAWVTSRE
ncbi:MAG: type VII toxin-antitoxin system MntA family adenylyltransferase antitoxin [Spirochaetota bacterium]